MSTAGVVTKAEAREEPRDGIPDEDVDVEVDVGAVGAVVSVLVVDDMFG